MGHRLDKDDDLVELERVEHLDQLAVLAGLLQLDVVLLQTVQRQLAVIVDLDVDRALREAAADEAHLGRDGRRKHAHLLLLRRRLEDVLHGRAHVCGQACVRRAGKFKGNSIN